MPFSHFPPTLSPIQAVSPHTSSHAVWEGLCLTHSHSTGSAKEVSTSMRAWRTFVFETEIWRDRQFDRSISEVRLFFWSEFNTTISNIPTPNSASTYVLLWFIEYDIKEYAISCFYYLLTDRTTTHPSPVLLIDRLQFIITIVFFFINQLMN